MPFVYIYDNISMVIIMNQDEKIILILGLIIIFLIILNIFKFINKNKEIFQKLRKTNKTIPAKVIEKRHYTTNNRNLFYIKFKYDEFEEEYLVSEIIYNNLFINQEGILTLKHNYFFDFK